MDNLRPSRADIEKALQLVQNAPPPASSRDHKATMDDKLMLETMAQSWPAWQQWFAQCQRDMARFPTNKEDADNLNMMMFAFSQILNRTMEAVEKGAELCQTR